MLGSEQLQIKRGEVAFEYYGNKITWKQLWEDVDVAARALKALGFNEGDRVPSFLVSTPAHFILLLAAERIGVAIICRDDEPEELCFAIRKRIAELNRYRSSSKDFLLSRAYIRPVYF